MSDESINEEVQKIAQLTKRNFDLKARLENRGLRRASITLFLDEEKGPELGWARDVKNRMQVVVGREQEGVLGEIDKIEIAKVIAQREWAKAAENKKMTAPEKKKGEDTLALLVSESDKKLEELFKQRDALIEELTKTGLTIQLRAVPPVIQKDTRRKAKATMEITGKEIPEDKQDEFEITVQAHLMAVMIQSIKDNETGEENTEITYDDAIDLMNLLPVGQFIRLDQKLGEVQFTDAISRSIEGQEDFS